MAKILTIDLGTSCFKLALFDQGALVDLCRLPTPAVAPRPGWAEIPPAQFAETLAAGIAQLRARDPRQLADVAAVCFATQTNSFLLLDAEDRPVTPIILWSDRRACGEFDFAEPGPVRDFHATTGVPQLGPEFMLAKLLWLRRHDPAILRQARRLCLISDYLTWLLTGRHVTEAGTAGLTGLVDIDGGGWWPAMLDRFDVDERLLPQLVRAGVDLGPLTPAAAARLALPPSCRFVVGCLDQYAGAIGLGAVTPGMMMETTGTVLATVQCVPRSQPTADVFCGPSFRPGLVWRMVFGNVSANYLEWYRGRLPGRPDLDTLLAAAAEVAPDADGLRLNAAAAESDPAEVFSGLTPRHTSGHAVRCILEAVADALRAQVARLSGGDGPSELRCAGGGARSALWLQIKADTLGIATVAGMCPEPTSLGAAILAEAALSGAGVPDVAAAWVRLRPPHRPTRGRPRADTCGEASCAS